MTGAFPVESHWTWPGSDWPSEKKHEASRKEIGQLSDLLT